VWRPAHACGPVAPPLLDERQADLAADPLAQWGGGGGGRAAGRAARKPAPAPRWGTQARV
jgi:hypothetical protein